MTIIFDYQDVYNPTELIILLEALVNKKFTKIALSEMNFLNTFICQDNIGDYYITDTNENEYRYNSILDKIDLVLVLPTESDVGFLNEFVTKIEKLNTIDRKYINNFKDYWE
jgi:hypothetical protein